MARLGVFAATVLYAELAKAQQSNITLPVPGEVIPESASGRPQLFFDARTTGFGKDGKQQVLDGDVIAIAGGRIVTADLVVFDQQTRKFSAEGHVVIVAANQILTGDKIEFFLDSEDFKLTSAKIVANDPEKAQGITKDVLGFSIQELNFEADRKARLEEVNSKKLEIRRGFENRTGLRGDPNDEELKVYTKLLEQEEMIKKQENPAFAHMTETRRNRIKKRRDFWDSSLDLQKGFDGKGLQSYYRFEGDEITKTNGNDFMAKNALVTPCRCEDDEAPAWGVRSAEAEAQMGGYATFRHALIEIKGVPVLYLPWLKVPVKDARQSGLIMPMFSQDAISGSGFSQPLYLDLGVDKDATIKGEVLEKRGLRAGLEFRWKRRKYSGFQLNIEGMRDRIWMSQRASRRDLFQMYKEGLQAARSEAPGTAPADISGFNDREYTRMRLMQRSWWEANAKECLDSDPIVSKQCEQSLLDAVRPPTNVNRGTAKWRLHDRLTDRLSLTSSGDLYSDRQYNPDVYIADSIQAGFESGSGERAINPVRTRLTYDGSDYFIGLGSYFGDSSRLRGRFEGYQLPLVAQARSKWLTLDLGSVSIYGRFFADDYRILRNRGIGVGSDQVSGMLPSGHWRRAQASFLAPLTGRTAVQVDHFTDLELRVMTFDAPKASAPSGTHSSLQSWKTGLRFQLPIDGRSVMPSWLSGISDQSGQRVLHHIMNWSMSLSARPMVKRRGPYGDDGGLIKKDLFSWFATDRRGSDDNIVATEFMDEHQIVTFATSHRWRLYSELWKTLPGEQSDRQKQEMANLSLEERARRELLNTMDQSIKGFDDLMSIDQKKWYSNRYQLTDSDQSEPVSFGASISYDRIKESRRKDEGKTRDNRPWSDLDSQLGLAISGWSLTSTSKYNVYDKTQTKFSTSLVWPEFFRSNLSTGYTLERVPTIVDNKLRFISTAERSVSLVTSLISPVTASWIFSRKDKVNDLPQEDYRQKASIVYGSSSGCWGLGFSREKGYGIDEAGASYLLQLNVTFMGQTRSFPNMSSAIERFIKKEQ